MIYKLVTDNFSIFHHFESFTLKILFDFLRFLRFILDNFLEKNVISSAFILKSIFTAISHSFEEVWNK